MEILFYLDNVHVLGKSEKLFNHIWQQNSNCTGTEFAVVALCCVSLNSIRIQTHSFFKVPLCYRKQLPKWTLFSWYILSGPVRRSKKSQKRTSSHSNPREKDGDSSNTRLNKMGFMRWMGCGCRSSFLRHEFYPWRAKIRDLINHSSCMPVRHRNVIAVISGVRQS